ncbi:hypothetical protein KQI52_07320 [bacterium]|nr:hypothetical protein [bacterium]
MKYFTTISAIIALMSVLVAIFTFIYPDNFLNNYRIFAIALLLLVSGSGVLIIIINIMPQQLKMNKEVDRIDKRLEEVKNELNYVGENTELLKKVTEGLGEFVLFDKRLPVITELYGDIADINTICLINMSNTVTEKVKTSLSELDNNITIIELPLTHDKFHRREILEASAISSSVLMIGTDNLEKDEFTYIDIAYIYGLSVALNRYLIGFSIENKNLPGILDNIIMIDENEYYSNPQKANRIVYDYMEIRRKQFKPLEELKQLEGNNQ